MKKLLLLLLLAMHLGITQQRLHAASMFSTKAIEETKSKAKAKKKSFFARHFGKMVTLSVVNIIGYQLLQTYGSRHPQLKELRDRLDINKNVFSTNPHLTFTISKQDTLSGLLYKISNQFSHQVNSLFQPTNIAITYDLCSKLLSLTTVYATYKKIESQDPEED